MGCSTLEVPDVGCRLSVAPARLHRSEMAQSASCSWTGHRTLAEKRQTSEVRSRKFLFPRFVHHKSLQLLRVVRLQSAVDASGDDNNSEAKMLRDALTKAQQEATSAPVDVRLVACAQFVESQDQVVQSRRCGKLKTRLERDDVQRLEARLRSRSAHHRRLAHKTKSRI